MAFTPPAILPDYSKLDSRLNATNLQKTNPELHAILKQLILAASQSQDVITGVPGGSSFSVIDIGGGGGGGGGSPTNLDYTGDFTPATYNDGNIVVAVDGVAYMCVKNGTTTPPEPWPGASGGNSIGSHHVNHETGGPDAITSISGTIITSGLIPDARLSINVLKYTGGYPGGTSGFLRSDGTFAAPTTGVPGPHHTTHEVGGGDQIINAAWTTIPNVFSQDQTISKNIPRLYFNDTPQPADKRLFLIGASNQQLAFYVLNDAANTILASPLILDRAGNAIVGGTLTANGLGTTPLNASNISSGTITDARLSSNVALKNIDNHFVPQTLASDTSIVGTYGVLNFYSSDAPVNAKRWRFVNYTDGNLHLESLDDPNVTVQQRFSFLGSGAFNCNQGITAVAYYEATRGVPVGYWTDIPYNPSNYTTNGNGSITPIAGAPYVYRYTLIGKTMILQAAARIVVNNGTTLEFRFAIPAGYPLRPYDYSATGGAAENQAGTASHYVALNSRLSAAAMAFINVSANCISVQRSDGTLGAGWFNGEPHLVQFTIEIPLA